MALTVFLTFLISLVLIEGRTEVGAEFSGAEVIPPSEIPPGTHFDVYASALSKAHYNPWACDYRSEPGYNCLSCNRALHCYPGNFALLVQCAGLFPFCRNGYCSRFKNEGCIEEPDGAAVHSSMPPYVQTFNKVNKTTIAPEVSMSQNTAENELHDSVQDENASNTVATQLNEPNKISGGTPSKPAQSSRRTINEERAKLDNSK